MKDFLIDAVLVMVIVITIFFLVNHKSAHADTVYSEDGIALNTEGGYISPNAKLEVYPKQFDSKSDAEVFAKTLNNGQVFKDVDTKKYIIIYGNATIIGQVVVPGITEE